MQPPQRIRGTVTAQPPTPGLLQQILQAALGPPAPQPGNEPDINYWLRSQVMPAVRSILPGAPGGPLGVQARPMAVSVGQGVRQGVGAAFDTPDARAARVQAAAPPAPAAPTGNPFAAQVQAQPRSGFQQNPYAAGVGATLAQAGIPHNVVAGILANGHYESGGWNIAGSGDSGTAHGAFQWRGERADNFRRVIGADPRRATPEQSARFVLWELQNPQQAGMTQEQVRAIMASGSPQEAAVRFSQFYERPNPQMANNSRRAFLAGQYASGGAVGGGGAQAGPSSAPPGTEAYQQWYDAFQQQLGATEQAAMTPQSMSFNMPSPPPLPAPAHFQPPDFAAGNAAFEQARPPNPFAEKGSETRMLREGFFRGMADALLATGTGPVGFGTLLMRAGAGALSGRMQGAERVRERMDRYDQLMMRYNEALASRNDSQATATANTINQNIELDNRHAYAQAQQNTGEFYRRNRLESQGNNLIVYSGEGDRQDVSIIPVQSMVAQQFGMLRAQAMLGAAGPAQQNAQWAWQQSQTMALQYAALGIGQGGSAAESGESLAFALSSTVVPLVDAGTIQNVIGQGPYQQLRQEYDSQINPIDPMQAANAGYGRDREAQWRDYLSQRIVRDAILNQPLAEQILGHYRSIGTAARAVERARSQRTSITRGRRGTTSTTSYEASDE